MERRKAHDGSGTLRHIDTGGVERTWVAVGRIPAQLSPDNEPTGPWYQRALHKMRMSKIRITRRAIVASGYLLYAWVICLWVRSGGLVVDDYPLLVASNVTRLAALMGTAMLLVQVAMMARIPIVEVAFGQVNLQKRHRTLGIVSFVLITIHVVFSVSVNSALAEERHIATLSRMLVTYPGVLLAAVSFAALVVVAFSSIRPIRQNITYEAWHLIHLYGYFGAGLAVPHQIWVGRSFNVSPLTALTWWFLWGAVAALVITYRIVVPLHRSYKHKMRVKKVIARGPNTVTVTISGKNLDQLGAHPGQFFYWRFLGLPGWIRAHPYSLSSAPKNDQYEITVAALGSDSRQIERLPIGSKVVFEGPYGICPRKKLVSSKTMLVGAGVGVAPLRSIVDGMAPGSDVVLLYRISDLDSDELLHDITITCAKKGAKLFLLSGERNHIKPSWLPASSDFRSDEEALLHYVPDVAERSIYLCGNKDWTLLVEDSLECLAVPQQKVFNLSFTL